MITSARAALYLRISEDDGSALGVGRQRADCAALATAKGWTVVETYIDNDVSASKASTVRPEYQRMLDDVRAGRINAVAVWDVDRLTRTPRELEDVIDFADAQGLRLASVGGDIDLATEQGRLTARLKGNVARYEVEQSARRLRRKFDELAAAGHPTGKVGYGYTRTHVVDKHGHRTSVDVVNPAEATIVKEAAARVLAGEGLWKIVNDLNSRGVTTNTGGSWRTQTLRRMLLRPRNAGLRVHRGKVIGKAAWEPILDRDTFDRLTATLTDPQRRSNNRGTAVKYLLTNRARCGVCAGMLVGTAEFVYSYRIYPHRYACNNPGCHKISRKMCDVDEAVEAVILARLERDGVTLLGGDPVVADAARERIAALEAKLSLTADQFAEDAITAEQLGRITAKLRPQLEAEHMRLARALPRGDLASFTGSNVRAAWGSAEVETKRAVFDALGMVVTLEPVGPGNKPGLEHITIKWAEREKPENPSG